MNDKNTGRILYFDLLNIAACFAVICLHHNGLVHVYTGDRVWKQCLVAECLFYWAVPVFLMLSGANLMTYQKKYSTKEFFRRRLLKVFIPWMFWSVLLFLWAVYRGRFILSELTLKEAVDVILNCRLESTYWFFPAIIGIYCLMPLLSCLTDDGFRPVLWLTVALFLLLNATLPLVCGLTGFRWNSAMSVPLHGYLVHVILGYLLATEEIPRTRRRRLYLFGILSFAVHYAGVYILSTRDGAKNGLFFNYNYIFSYGLAAAVFVFFKYAPWDKALGKYSGAIARISSCSLGIYLIHQLVMAFERKLFLWEDGSLSWRTAGIFCTYLISLIIVCVIKKIPVLKRIVP